MGRGKKGYAGPIVKDTETFLMKAHWQHGDRYNYSKTVYNGATNKVVIGCAHHGDFEQRASDHANKGAGCPSCRNENTSKRCKLSLREFTDRANQIHENKYDYTKVVYENSTTKVEIICPTHGSFWQQPYCHSVIGRGCQSCVSDTRKKEKAERDAERAEKILNEALERAAINPSQRHAQVIYTTEYFIERSIKIHGERYDYSKVKYKNNSTKVNIVCKEHGDFWQKPNSHLLGVGCNACGYEKTSKYFMADKEQFIKDARRTHPDKGYSYTNVIYTGNKNKVEIICKHHGSFWQTPNNHLIGSGCPECAYASSGWGGSGFYATDKPSNLYIMSLSGDGEEFIKVGLSNNIERRRSDISKRSGYDVKIAHVYQGKAKELFSLEQNILRFSGVARYSPKNTFEGASECIEVKELKKVMKLIERNDNHV